VAIKLHAHQEKGVAKMHNGCILYGDVGVGKTITSLAYYFTRVCGGELNKWGSMQTPKDVYVITTAKVRDSKGFELQAAKMGVHEDPSLSTNGVRITVDSWNNLHKYVEVKDAFFIFDEQRVVGYGAWSRAFIKVAKHNEWILLSATPGDTWMDYIPVFIANGWYKHKTDFIDQHVIWTPRVKYPKVLRYQDVGTLVRRRNEVLVHMPYDRHTKRHPVDVWCEFDTLAFEKAVKRRWHVFEERPLRDVSELFSVMRRIVNSDESRSNAVRSLLKKHPKLIVFYNFDYELEMLRELGAKLQADSHPPFDCGEDCPGCELNDGEFGFAEWNGHKHEEIPTTDRWLYAVQYRAGAEGWNCVDTDAICFWSQTYSYRDWWQSHGRIDRLNTSYVDLYYYHLVSRSAIDAAIRKALKAKKSFNERDLVIPGL
jgi:hypothetical protein